MNLNVFRFGGLLVVAVVLPLMACGSQDAAEPDSSETSETTDTPETEGTGPEPPRPDDDGVSVSLPGLPVGGGAEDGSQERQCVSVAWLGDEDIPDGVAVAVSGVSIDPSGVFEVDGSSCGGSPGCEESFAFTPTDELCSVPIRALGTDGAEAELRLSGSARCADAGRCDEFAATVSGQSIQVRQPYEETGETDETEGSSEEPTTDEPTSTG